MRHVIALLHPSCVRIDGTGGFGSTRRRRREVFPRERRVLGGICVVGLNTRSRSRSRSRALTRWASSALLPLAVTAASRVVVVVVVAELELILSFNGTYRAHRPPLAAISCSRVEARVRPRGRPRADPIPLSAPNFAILFGH